MDSSSSDESDDDFKPPSSPGPPPYSATNNDSNVCSYTTEVCRKQAKFHCSSCDGVAIFCGTHCDAHEEEFEGHKCLSVHELDRVVQLRTAKRQKDEVVEQLEHMQFKNETQYPPCLTHKKQIYVKFCVTCKLLVCVDCVTETHTKHELKDIPDQLEYIEKTDTARHEVLVKRVFDKEVGLAQSRKDMTAQFVTWNTKVRAIERELCDIIKTEANGMCQALSTTVADFVSSNEQMCKTCSTSMKQIETDLQNFRAATVTKDTYSLLQTYNKLQTWHTTVQAEILPLKQDMIECVFVDVNKFKKTFNMGGVKYTESASSSSAVAPTKAFQFVNSQFPEVKKLMILGGGSPSAVAWFDYGRGKWSDYVSRNIEFTSKTFVAKYKDNVFMGGFPNVTNMLRYRLLSPENFDQTDTVVNTYEFRGMEHLEDAAAIEMGTDKIFMHGGMCKNSHPFDGSIVLSPESQGAVFGPTFRHLRMNHSIGLIDENNGHVFGGVAPIGASGYTSSLFSVERFDRRETASSDVSSVAPFTIKQNAVVRVSPYTYLCKGHKALCLFDIRNDAWQVSPIGYPGNPYDACNGLHVMNINGRLIVRMLSGGYLYDCPFDNLWLDRPISWSRCISLPEKPTHNCSSFSVVF